MKRGWRKAVVHSARGLPARRRGVVSLVKVGEVRRWVVVRSRGRRVRGSWRGREGG